MTTVKKQMPLAKKKITEAARNEAVEKLKQMLLARSKK
jgi:hypothetical protein